MLALRSTLKTAICKYHRGKKIEFPKKEIQKTQSCEAYTALFIAEHCSVMTVDHLGPLIEKVGGDSEGIKVMQYIEQNVPT